LPRVSARASDKPQGLVDSVDIAAQSFKFFARGLHRCAAGADLGEAGNEFVYVHVSLLSVIGLCDVASRSILRIDFTIK
jgi:hypothetical protein